MNKYTELTILFFLIILKVNAQKTGINVLLPLSDLHIEGKLQITKDLNFGGTESTKGFSGTNGQILKSNGEGKAPEWSTLSIPIVSPGSFTMTNSSVFVDHQGVILRDGAGRRVYELNEKLDTPPPSNDLKAVWTKFPQLIDIPIVIDNSKNKINLTLQTISSIAPKTSSKETFTYAIGFFINNELKSVKTFKSEGTKDVFEVTTVISTLQNLPISGSKLTVAIMPRLKSSSNSGNLSIGCSNSEDPNLLSTFMANTTLKIDVFEVIN
ncbi:hypothetical protein LNQ81_16220 [Myroides sp. M-43]|uniref:hypothetical protein n=1 Tax=Myroides oncorhynchi TaxID=2893756 RepID=UPI001E54F356|nr:hypothetical protein [Myroides oncorhynchi]MCC9044218.1 hypothetical protein [Myroides oncorhynchi]